MRSLRLSLWFTATVMLLHGCRTDRSPNHQTTSDASPRPGSHCAHHNTDAAPVATPLPGTSLYQLDATWTTQNQTPFRLSSLRGSPALVLLFYGTCRTVCPLLIQDLQRIEAALSDDVRRRLRVVLITIDPQNDTPERLHVLAREKSLDLSRWVLLHGSEGDIRNVAMALGVQYRQLGPGEFSHSNVITLLDPNGVVAYQLNGLRQPVNEIARRIIELAR